MKTTHIIVDAFWGSSGKGKLAAYLADQLRITQSSSSNFPNAGHTVRICDEKLVFKVLPAAVAGKFTNGRNDQPVCWITANSGFRMEQLVSEWRMLDYPSIVIHERAVVVSEEHAKTERQSGKLQSISSTFQGSAAAAADKLFRRPVLMQDTVKHHSHLSKKELDIWHETVTIAEPRVWHKSRNAEAALAPWLHEVSQGFALGINTGTHYPHCTSRECSAQQATVDLMLPRWAPTKTWLNVRSFPIRVGNFQNNYSGDFMPDGPEITLAAVAEGAGIPADMMDEIRTIETTTVTKRARRISEISMSLLKYAAEMNDADAISLNFAQYIDWRDYKVKNKPNLTRKTRKFIDKLEEETQLPVELVGTGPDHWDWVWMS